MRLKIYHTCSFCVCLFLSVTGLCFIFAWDLMFHCLLSLECNPHLYSIWKVLPVDLPTEFYFFNWTNPDDFYDHSIKPKFQEIGPYVFMQREEKDDMVWNNNATVTFNQKKFWYYDENISRSLDDEISVVDTTAISISYITRDWNYYLRKAVFVTLSPYLTSINRKQTVQELLFDGYSEPLIRVLAAMPFFAYLNLPNWDRFGWMVHRNGSSDFDGVFNMDYSKNLGQIYSWNYHEQTDFFEGECNKVLGSTGQFYKRNLKKNETIVLFSTDLRRTLSFKYAYETKVKDILGYTFIAEDFTFDNGTVNPKTKCFCPDECTPSGLVNISLTRHYSPLFASLPHFYAADPYYINMVEGLNPEKQKHEIFITVEPTTGLVIDMDVKLQMNILIQPIKGTLLLEDARKVFFPIFWSRQKASIPNREAVIVKLMLCLNRFHTVIGLGLIALATGLFLYKWYRYRKVLRKDSQKSVEENFMPHLIHLEKLNDFPSTNKKEPYVGVK